MKIEKVSRIIDGHKDNQMNRRKFLTGLGAATSGIGAAGLFTKKDTDDYFPKDTNEHTNNHTTIEDIIRESTNEYTAPESNSQEDIRESSNSIYFAYTINKLIPHFNTDLKKIMEYGNKITNNDPKGRTRIRYVFDELKIQEASNLINNEMKKCIIGICIEESRFDASRTSRSGAKGILQIMPKTWEEHGDPNGNILSLVDQMKAVNSLLTQTHRYLQNKYLGALDTIKINYFEDSQTDFEKYFMVPIIINSYNAGMGTMGKIITQFANKYRNKNECTKALNVDKAVSDYDVFFTMSTLARAQGVNNLYKEDASNYTPKVYAALLSLMKHTNNKI